MSTINMTQLMQYFDSNFTKKLFLEESIDFDALKNKSMSSLETLQEEMRITKQLHNVPENRTM